MRDKERVRYAIKTLKRMLKEPDITESRTTAIMRQLGKYQEFLAQLESDN